MFNYLTQQVRCHHSDKGHSFRIGYRLFITPQFAHTQINPALGKWRIKYNYRHKIKIMSNIQTPNKTELAPYQTKESSMTDETINPFKKFRKT
jgi:hypothetical protein